MRGPGVQCLHSYSFGEPTGLREQSSDLCQTLRAKIIKFIAFTRYNSMKFMKHSQNFYKFPESTNFILPMPTLILLIAFFSLPRTHTWNYRIPIIKIRRIRIILFIPAKPPSDKSSPHSLPSRNLSPSNIEDQLFWFSSNGTRICLTLLSFAAAILWRWFVLVRVRVETVATRCFCTCVSYETQLL